MKVQSIFENNFYILKKDIILDFCKKAFLEKNEPSYVNMWDDNWEYNSATFPYLVYNSSRFSNGNGDMFALFDDFNNLIGVSGVNISDFDPYVALGGVRTWLNKEYRGKFLVGRYLLPKQLLWAKNKNMKIITITLNDYNKRLLPYFTREGLGISKKRTSENMFYNGQYILDFPVIINHTKQWVLYHKIDETYEVDWDAIKYQDK